MTKDKTVTMSRELAERLDSPHSSVRNSAIESLRRILAAPVVERQEPVAYLDERGKFVFIGYDALRSACWVDADNRAIPNAWQPVCASPPAPVAVVLPDVDMLAQIIRTVDGNHSLGASALAERILDKVKEMNQPPRKMCDCNQGRLPCTCKELSE